MFDRLNIANPGENIESNVSYEQIYLHNDADDIEYLVLEHMKDNKIIILAD